MKPCSATIRRRSARRCSSAEPGAGGTPPDGGYGGYGGHPLPLCRRADGTIETVGRLGSFLGMEETADISECAAVLTPRYMVVLYTDGVTEARHGGAFFGEAGIAEVLGASAELTAQAVADAVVAAALAFQDGPARDDIAVVVVKVPPSGPS